MAKDTFEYTNYTYYKVQSNGSAPDGLGAGDLVVTGGGTYEILSAEIVYDALGIGQYVYQSRLMTSAITTNTFEQYSKAYGIYYSTPPQVTQQVKQQHTQYISASVDRSKSDIDPLLLDNYIYFYHLDKFIILPTFAESITDSLSVNFQSSTPLSRTAPIYSYANSGPRTVGVSFKLHRDLMTDLNYGKSNVTLDPELSDDYVDVLIRYIQATALPRYNVTNKMVNPPVIALRLGNDVFIKGVLSSAIQLTYQLPLLRNGKYAVVDFGLSVNEVEPFDADQVIKYGSYRGIDTTLENRLSSITGSATTGIGSSIWNGSGVSGIPGINSQLTEIQY